MSELENWCKNNSQIPSSIHEPYVSSFYINNGNDDGRAVADELENEDDIDEEDEHEKLPFFRFIITSKHLLKQAVDKCNTDATV